MKETKKFIKSEIKKTTHNLKYFYKKLTIYALIGIFLSFFWHMLNIFLFFYFNINMIEKPLLQMLMYISFWEFSIKRSFQLLGELIKKD